MAQRITGVRRRKGGTPQPDSRRFPWLLVLLVALACPPGVAAAEPTVRSLAEIEAALDPLEFLADHGGVRRSIDLRIAFALGSADLLPAAQRQIEVLGDALRGERLDGYEILLVGHTDASGNDALNRELSARRANAVRDALIERHGVAPERLRAEGRGEEALLDGFAPTAAMHRRVEVIASESDGAHAVGRRTEDEHEEGESRIEW